MMKILKWRLGKLPTVEELLNLINARLITQQEAKDILFNSETEEDRDKKSLESEIKFLRELIERLSNSSTKIVETIRYIEKPYYSQPWYQPYAVWCSNGTSLTTTGGNTYGNTVTATNTVNPNTFNLGSASTVSDNKFSNIKTF